MVVSIDCEFYLYFVIFYKMIWFIYILLEFGFLVCIWELPFWQFLGAIIFCYGMEKLREWIGEQRGRGTPFGGSNKRIDKFDYNQ